MNGTRAESAARVAELKAQGLNGIQIAARLGISRSYAYELLTDPDGHEARRRKRLNGGTCKTCGAATDGSNGRSNVPDECAECARRRAHDQRYWTPKRIVYELQAWARDLGRPPLATEALRAGARVPTSAAQREFGSWTRAMAAAGMAVARPRLCGEAFERACREAAAMRGAGMRLEEIAVRQGVHVGTVEYRLRRAAGAPPAEAAHGGTVAVARRRQRVAAGAAEPLSRDTIDELEHELASLTGVPA